VVVLDLRCHERFDAGTSVDSFKSLVNG